MSYISFYTDDTYTDTLCGSSFTHTANFIVSESDNTIVEEPYCVCDKVDDECPESCDLDIREGDYAWILFNQGVTYDGETVNQILVEPRLNQLS